MKMVYVKFSSLALGAMLALTFLMVPASATQYVFGVRGDSTTINGKGFVAKGLRCSQSLITQAATDSLIFYLDTFKYYGCNMISVYIMGSRYGNIPGYICDGTLNPTYSARLGQIIEAADSKGMIILVGCLYWGGTNAKCANWGQSNVDTAVANTARWISSHNYRNVFVDIDNEGMAGGIIPNKVEAMQSGRNVDPKILFSSDWGDAAASAAADLVVHIGTQVAGKPYIESEGCGSWCYGSGNYCGVGTQHGGCGSSSMAAAGPKGFLLADMWLQAPPPLGPNMNPGTTSVGIRAQLVSLKNAWGSWNPPPPLVVGVSHELPSRRIATTAYDNVKVFDLRGKLVATHFGNMPNASMKLLSRNTGVNVVVYSKGNDIINIKSFCNTGR
jgi:hypothetical protein